MITARYECSTSSGLVTVKTVSPFVSSVRAVPTVTQVAVVTCVVIVVTIRSRCRVTEAFRRFASKFAVHAALVPEFATGERRGLEHGDDHVIGRRELAVRDRQPEPEGGDASRVR